MKRMLWATGLWISAAVTASSAEPESPLILEPEIRVIYSWQHQRCAKWHVPDTPARAWRGVDGDVYLAAGAEQNRLLIGRSLDRLEADCRVILTGAKNSDPAAREDRWWIASIYLHEDGRLEALVHAEYHGHSHSGQCDGAGYLTCWRNAILQAESHDGGLSFVVDVADPVAVLPYPYDPAQQGRSGYFSPSNILEKDGYLYFFVYAAPYRSQQRGVCLIRRPVAGGPGDWRAWDGASFAIRFVDPYRKALPDPARHVCEPLQRVWGNLTSIVEHEGNFLAVSPMGGPPMPETERVDGFWTLRSSDLINWDEPRLLVKLPLLWRRDCSQEFTYAYPAFLDPASHSSGFQTVGDTFWLTYVRMRLDARCRASPERDLVRQTVYVDRGD